jgi:hypothetical protein
MFRKKYIIALGICVSILIPRSVIAAVSSALDTAPSIAAVSPTAVAPATTANVDPKLIENSLRDLGDTLKKVYSAANSLQAECNRVYNADALDNVIMDPWMEGQPGLAHVIPPPFPGALKPLPARKKWIDYDQNQITQLLKILTTEVNGISGASSIDTSIRVSVEIVQDNLQQVDAQYARLNALTNPSSLDDKGQPAYDKAAISKAAQALKDEASGLNEIRKRLLRQISEFDKSKR